MKIAILTPSRERIHLKRNLVESIKATASSLDGITLHFGIDDDDPTYGEVEKMASENKFINIVRIHNEGKFIGLGNLWNACADAAKEDILAMVGDDMVFTTPKWDIEILKEFSEGNCPPDNLKLVYCRDGYQNGHLAVNSFIHRVYMEITGYYVRTEFPFDYIDDWLYESFRRIERLKYRDDIYIEHRHWHLGKMEKDHIVDRMRAVGDRESNSKIWKTLAPEREDELRKLKARIECRKTS